MDKNLQNNSGLEDKPKIGLRWILVTVIFFTYLVVFYTMNCFGVLVVAMTNSNSSSSSNDSHITDACDFVDAADGAANFSSGVHDKRRIEGEYDWTILEKGFIMGAYFWGFTLGKLLLSRIGEKIIGPRATISIAMLIMGILSIISPLCSSIGPYALSLNRFLSGICAGPITSQVPSLISAWAPRSELGTICNVADSGIVTGNTIGLFTSSWISKRFGWRTVFYFEGILALLIVPLWIIFVRNSPFIHPWLSSYEENLLSANKIIRTKKKVPYLKIFTSRYVYICIYCQFVYMWTNTFFVTVGPLFFRYKLGFYLENAGYVLALSNCLSIFWIISNGFVSDLIINKKILSKTNTRKTFHLIGTGIIGLLIIVVPLAGCNFQAVIFLWIVIMILGYSVHSSFRISSIDIAPNFTVIVNSMMAIGNIGNALSPIVISALLDNNKGWDFGFYLTSAINFVSLILYVSFMTSKPQAWNFIEENKPEELEKLEIEMKNPKESERDE